MPTTIKADEGLTDVYEVHGSCAEKRGFDFLVCRTLSDAFDFAEEALDDAGEVRILFRRYSQRQLDEIYDDD